MSRIEVPPQADWPRPMMTRSAENSGVSYPASLELTGGFRLLIYGRSPWSRSPARAVLARDAKYWWPCHPKFPGCQHVSCAAWGCREVAFASLQRHGRRVSYCRKHLRRGFVWLPAAPTGLVMCVAELEVDEAAPPFGAGRA